MRALTLFVLLLLLATQGCAVVAVGAVAAAAAGVTYTMLGTAEKTFNEDYDTVLAALQKALAGLDIKTGETKTTEEKKRRTRRVRLMKLSRVWAGAYLSGSSALM